MVAATKADAPRIIWVTEQFTKPGGGARICMIRHALAFRDEGLSQQFVLPSRYAGQEEHSEMEEMFGRQSLDVIAARKPWWPPIRSWLPFSRALRSRLLLDSILTPAKHFKPDVVITTNYLSFPSFAIGVARNLNVPLAVMVYDAVEDWREEAGQREVLLARTRLLFDRADHVWFVSKELRSVYENRGLLRQPGKTSILLPMPTSAEVPVAQWHPDMARTPVVGFAGQVHAVEDLESVELCAQALSRIGGQLLLAVPDEQRALLEPLRQRHHCAIEYLPWQDTPEQALTVMSRRVSAMLVPCGMRLGRGAMAMTSFPSKLLDYCQMGVPVIVLAAAKSPVMRWAGEVDWPTRLAEPDVEACTAMLERLKDPDFWKMAATQARHKASTEFDHRAIHSQFRAELPSAAAVAARSVG